MTKKISVIIPCYNVEPYVERAINSVVNQTYKNIEIIAVDDGSTDDTLSILKKLRKKISNIKIISQKNRGYGSAVQNGIDASQGEYIIILEPDDYWDNFYLEPLVCEAVGSCSDVVFYNSYFEVRTGFRYKLINQYFHGRYLGPYQLSETEIEQRLVSGAVGICFALYDRKFLTTYKIKLNTTIRAYEDDIFIFKVMMLARKVSIIPGGGYFYSRDIPGQSVTSPERFESIIRVVEEMGSCLNEGCPRTPALVGYILTHLQTYFWKTKGASLELINSVIVEKTKTFSQLKGKISRRCYDHLKDILKLKEIRPTVLEVADGYKKIPPLHVAYTQQNERIPFLSFAKWKLAYFYDNQLPILHFFSELSTLLNVVGFTEVKLIRELFLKIISKEDFKYLEKIHKLNAYNTLCILRNENAISNILPYFDNNSQKEIVRKFLFSGTFPELQHVNEFKEYFHFFRQAFKTNLEQLHAFLSNKNIMVVGNSPCEIGKEKGHLIDNSDVVLRFNNYSLSSEYSRDYGTKMDCWAITPALQTIKYNSYVGASKFIITPFCNNFNEVYRINYLMMFQRVGIKVVYFPVNDILWKYNLNTMSLGLLTVIYILQHINYNSLSICGFNLSDQLRGVSHYFSGDPSEGKKVIVHAWMKEALILNSLIDQKRINHV